MDTDEFPHRITYQVAIVCFKHTTIEFAVYHCCDKHDYCGMMSGIYCTNALAFHN